MKVVIPTCDEYSQIIPTFWHFYKKNWKDNPYKTEFVTETKEFNFGDFVFYGGKISWAERMIKYLKQLDEDKLLLILDDYILKSNIDSHKVKIAESLCKDDIGCVKLAINDEGASWNGLMVDTEVEGFEEYPDRALLGGLHSISFQVAIWQKSALLDILQPGESIWESEVKGSMRFRKRVLRPNVPIIDYSPCGYMKKGSPVEAVAKWVDENW